MSPQEARACFDSRFEVELTAENQLAGQGSILLAVELNYAGPDGYGPEDWVVMLDGQPVTARFVEGKSHSRDGQERVVLRSVMVDNVNSGEREFTYKATIGTSICTGASMSGTSDVYGWLLSETVPVDVAD